MRRRQKHVPKEVKVLPKFQATDQWLHLEAMSAWVGLAQGRNTAVLCTLQMRGAIPDPNVRDSWTLTIRRINIDNGLRKWFASSLSYRSGNESGSDEFELPLLAGPCRGWGDAISQVASDAPFIEVIKSIGRQIYGSKNDWQLVRPFRVQWPWRDFREPNAAHSEFHLVGDWHFDAEVDGAVVSCRHVSLTEAREFSRSCGANAFLLGPYADQQYRLYHRGDMSSFDVIDIDDWRARIIASTREI